MTLLKRNSMSTQQAANSARAGPVTRAGPGVPVTASHHGRSERGRVELPAIRGHALMIDDVVQSRAERSGRNDSWVARHPWATISTRVIPPGTTAKS